MGLGEKTPTDLDEFCDLIAKITILTPFESRLGGFGKILIIKFPKFGRHLNE